MVCIPILLVILASGCVQQETPAERARALCIGSCLDAQARGEDLSNGPCLSDQMIEDWVCDVAHSPRQDVDNLPENQCPAWQVTAHHFVEVDPECNFIRAV